MIGAIIGDVCGSAYEFEGNKDPAVALFPPDANFTDDTVLTVATARALLDGTHYRDAYLSFGRRFPEPTGGYGSSFRTWLGSLSGEPYGSWGNGSAMRVSPIAWAFDDLSTARLEAKRSASVTHNHPEGIKGAEATVSAVWLARHRATKPEIRDYVVREFGYDLSRSAAAVRDDYCFNESCQKTVPEALIAFLDSTSFESAIRIAISLGGDADTVACITGAVAHAFYRGVPGVMEQAALVLLPPELADTVVEFRQIHVGA
jgi:ADP-ribosylglycohydrolase